VIDLPAGAPSIFMDVKRTALHGSNGRRWQADFIFYWLTVIGQLEFRVIYAVELSKHSDKIGLTAKQLADNDTRAVSQRLPAEMLAGKHALRLDEFFVKFRQGQLGW
jgi:hypothetical protein